MPVFNGEAFLDEAILSIRTQSLKDFEFLIVDDGSVDASTEIIDRHRVEDPRILLHSRDHCGQVDAMKFAALVARGKYLARMDADDVSTTNRLEAQLNYLEAHPEVAVLGTQIEFIDNTGTLISRSLYPSEPDLVRKELSRSNCICHSATMFRRSAYDRAGGYRTCFAPAEDYDLWIRMLRFAELANLPEFLLKYRINFSGQSFRRPWQQALGLSTAKQIMQSQTEIEIDADQPITYDRAKQIGLDLDTLNSEIVRVYKNYFQFAVVLGRHRFVSQMLRDMLNRLSFSKPASGELLLEIAHIYIAEDRPFRAIPYIVIGMSRRGSAIADIFRRLADLAFEKEKKILLETSLTTPPDQLPIGGYVDQVLTNEARTELTMTGWSPFLKSAPERRKMLVYCSQPTVKARVSRNRRPDVAEKHSSCEKTGFSCQLSFLRPDESRQPIVTVFDAEGRQYRLVSATSENSSLFVEGLTDCGKAY